MKVKIDKHPLLISKGHKPRKGIVKECICGREFYVRPSVISTNNFCSRECSNKRPTNKLTLSCKFCEKTYSTHASHVKHRGSSFCSRICGGKFKSLQQLGENNPGWKGGVSTEHHRLRQSKAFKVWRESVFERDNYTCVMCGVRGGYLEPDHVRPFAYFPELRFDINNGRTLCKPCHKETDTYGHKARKLYEVQSY